MNIDSRLKRFLQMTLVALVVLFPVFLYCSAELAAWFKESAAEQTLGRRVLGPFDLTINWTVILAGTVCCYSAAHIIFHGLDRLIRGNREVPLRRPLINFSASLLVVVLGYIISGALFEGV